jgi:hypothetical protein
MQRATLPLLTLIALAGCGGKSEDKPAAKDAGATPTVAPIAAPISGVDSIRRMNYQWGSEGSKEFAKAVIACCAKGKAKDWAGTRAHAEAALTKDAHHIGAHWLLGVALAQTGEPAAAVEHLAQAIASDYGRYGASFATEEDLAPFLATKHGAAVSELAARIRDDYRKRAARGVLVVGRRSAFRWPDKPGVQDDTSRGELYAYDRETRHYLRLTHTNDSVVGFVRSPAGNELAVLGFDRVDRPAAASSKTPDAPPDPAPLIARAFVMTVDTTEWKPSPRAVIAGPMREVIVGYGEGEQLLVATAPAAGRWGVGTPVVSSVDRTSGKLAKSAAALPVPRIAFTLEEGRVMRGATEDVKAIWMGSPPTAPRLEVDGKAIAVPESGVTAQATVARGAQAVAFATAVDPCATAVAPSLYVAVLKTTPPTLKHVLTAASRFTTRWVSDTLLAYEDGDGAIRLWDVTTLREVQKLENRAGLALEVLSLAPAPLCKQAPPSAEPGAGSDEPLPPEESSGGSGSAPVTVPQ